MARHVIRNNGASRATMLLTVKQAADAIGKSKPTIMRAIQGGIISATKDQHGVWRLDASELHRVFQPVSSTEPTRRHTGASDTATEAELLRRMLADRDVTIDDLRRRLDAEAEERRRVQQQLTALLTDASKALPAKGKSWFGWLMRSRN